MRLLGRFQPEQRPSDQDFRIDLTYLALGFLAITPLAQQMIRVFAYVVAASFLSTGATIWPSGWPILLQLLLAVVVGEFGQYWFHRFAHSTDLGWRVHATHHGTPQVYWLNATRFHPIETVVKNLFQVGPLILLGCSRETFLVYGVVTACHGWVQHSNVAYRIGLFNLVMATPTNHRWHHSLKLQEANSNYGNVTVIWDHVFGSFFKSRGRQFAGGIGIGDMPDFPKTYFGQLFSPFTWRRLPRTAAVSTPVTPTVIEAPAREVA